MPSHIPIDPNLNTCNSDVIYTPSICFDVDCSVQITITNDGNLIFKDQYNDYTSLSDLLNPNISFLDLIDTPDSYIGNSGKFVAVSGNSLQFVEVSSNVFGYNDTIICEIGQDIYDVIYPFNLFSSPNPVISLVIPVSSSPIFIHSITEVSSAGFKVILSSPPSIDGYKINWTINNTPSTTVNITGTGNVSYISKEVNIPIGSLYSPPISGASLLPIQNSSGMYIDTFDFSFGDEAYINFKIPDNFIYGSDFKIDLYSFSQNIINETFQLTVDDLSTGENPLTSIAHTPVSNTISYTSINSLVITTFTFSSSINQDTNPNDILYIKIKRASNNSIDDISVIGLKFYFD